MPMTSRTFSDVAAPGLSGHLEDFSPFDILQVMRFLRRSGRLDFHRRDGLRAGCTVRDGNVIGAECGHLEGAEALLTLLWWRDGEFRFDAHAAVAAEAPALATEELMMNAVRLADEVELRSDQLPRADVPLALASGARLPEDSLSCGLAQVFSYLQEHPRLLPAELERVLPLSLIKIRLALILLRPQLVGEQDASAPAEATPASRWWNELCRRDPAGLRVLVAFAVSSPFADIDRAVREIGSALKAPLNASAVSALGPSFVRFRPPQGGLLSLTFLPITAKHRYLLETFAGSVAAVVFSGWTAAGEEAEVWTSMVPQTVDFEVLDETRNLAEELARTLRRLARASA